MNVPIPEVDRKDQHAFHSPKLIITSHQTLILKLLLFLGMFLAQKLVSKANMILINSVCKYTIIFIYSVQCLKCP